MAINNDILKVKIVKQGFQKRVLFDGFKEENDRNPGTRKIGVRCHSWFTAFFLRIFGKIKIQKTTKGILYLNKESLRVWKKRHQKDAIQTKAGSVPTILNIVLGHKKRNAAALCLQNAFRTALAKQQMKAKQEIRDLENEVASLQERQNERQIQFNQGSEKIAKNLQLFKDLECLISRVNEAINNLNTKVSNLEKESKRPFSKKKSNKEKLAAFRNQLAIFDKEMADYKNKQDKITKENKKLESTLQLVQKDIEKENQTLQEKRANLEKRLKTHQKKTLPLNKKNVPQENKLRLTNANSESTVQTETATKMHNLLEMVDRKGGEQIKRLMSVILNHFDESAIRDIKVQDGSFMIFIKETKKLFLNSNSDTTPQGVIYLFGANDENVIKGRIQNNTIIYERGFQSFSPFSKKIWFATISGTANSTIEKLTYIPSEDQIAVNCYAQAKWEWGAKSEKMTIKTIYPQLLNLWKEAEVVNEKDHEKYLSQKKINP